MPYPKELFLRRYKVIADYDIAYPHPIKLLVGDRVLITKRETNPDWLGWVFCVRDDGVAGWVSETYLEITGDTGQVLRNYDATEIQVRAGEVVQSSHDEFGWAWVATQRVARAGSL